MHGRVSSTAVNQLLWSKQNLTELRKLTNINYKHIGHTATCTTYNLGKRLMKHL